MSGMLLQCVIAGKKVAIPAEDIQSVIELGPVTPVPRAPAHILGLTALRSQALTVVDCAKALGLAAPECSQESRAVVIKADEHLYALVVEEANSVAKISGDIAPLAGGFGEEWERIAKGIVETGEGPHLLIDAVPMLHPTSKSTA
jgi:purine-binding chemotaxis protein CheW